MKSVRPDILKDEDNGLILFYHSQSFYCQKVLFALHEKGVPFRGYEVDVANGEQYSDWFLELNAKGEIPVLKNGSLIIPVAAQIINYVEKNFSGDSIKGLLPATNDEKIFKQILQFSRIISRLPIGAISKGAFAHAAALKLNPKLPFIQPVREVFLNSNDKLISSLKLHADQSVKYKNVLLAKADECARQPRNIPNRVEFEIILKKLEALFDILEMLLKCNKKWFLSDKITIMDICFGILLHRLNMLGLDKKLWADRKRISEYFQRISELPSFQLSIPSGTSNAKAMWSKLPDPYKYASIGVISISSLGLITVLKLVL